MYDKADLFDILGHHTRLIQENDSAELQTLLERCADYNILVDGYPPKPSAAITLISMRPEGKAVDDKVTIGIYSSEKLMIGVLDVVRDYPRQDDWWIGLLLLDPDYRGLGLGRRIVQSFEEWIHQRGAKYLFLGVVEKNEKAYSFWRSAGFTEIARQPPRQFGDLTHVVITMMKELVGAEYDRNSSG